MKPFNIQSTVAGLATTITGGAGNDTFNVGSSSNALDPILGPLTVNGQGGTDSLSFNDQGSTVGQNYIMTASTFGRSGAGLTTFSAAEKVTINAGAGNDSLIASGGLPTTPVTFKAGGGTNTVTGPYLPNTWVVGPTNAGSLGAFKFSSVQNLVGGKASDIFSLANGAGLSGTLNGGLGSNALSYQLYTTAVTVNLVTGAATNIAGGISNITSVAGGSNDDTLTGNNQANIILGGAGNDTITGGNGRSILIGGLGGDTIKGGTNDDLIIGGSTTYDTNGQALLSILAEWKRTDANYATRVAHLKGTQTGGLNGAYVLKSTTVKDDGVADTLTGNAGTDWFWANIAEITDLVAGEQVN